MQAGTLKDWSKPRVYHGVLRHGSEIDWKCEHAHPTSHAALDCAIGQLNLRAALAPQEGN